MDSKPAKPKEKRRNSERRKEKSRDAARCRRSKESVIFTDLAHALPLPASTVAGLDKASVMRLAISFLRVRSLIDNTIPMEVKEEPVKPSPEMYDGLFLKALEGFLLVVSGDGDIVFLSENVQDYLGLSQIDLMGQSIYEVSHPCDHSEVKEILTGKDIESLQRTFFLRMKCTLTGKGRNVNLKSATYKVIHCTGHMVSSDTQSDNGSSSDEGIDTGSSPGSQLCLVAIGEPIPHPANIEIPLGYQTFLSKHSLDMKFTYADDKMAEFLGYDPEQLIGKSVYEFYHTQDSQTVLKAFKGLHSKGQTQTGRCRFLAHGGGYMWILTQATLIYNNKGHKPQSIVCVHFVTSGVEHKDEIYSSSQLENAVAVKQEVEVRKCPDPATAEQLVRKVFPPAAPLRQTVTAKLFAPLSKDTVSHPQCKPVQPVAPQPKPPTAAPTRPTAVTSKVFSKIADSQPRPQTATAKIFAPRTEDMNKGFLMFSDDESGLTMMKDEPEDLTHLAPTAGDVCVPLVANGLFNDMLDHFMLSDNNCYGPLLSETSKEPSPASSPYFSYRDELSSGSLSPPFTHSPGESSLPSLLGEESPPLEEGTSMSTLLGLDSLDSDDLSVKAPYISMSEGDDLPLLMSHDLMWGASTIPSPSNQDGWSSPPPPLVVDKPDLDSSLAKLLRSETSSSIRNFSQHSPTSNTQTFTPKKGEGGGERRKRPVTEPSSNARNTNSKRSKHSASTIPRPGVLDGGGKPPPNSGSVLMNLLVSGCDAGGGARVADTRSRLKSLSLLDPDCDIKLVDLTEQDYDVNAPTGVLLHGSEILTALDIPM
ncbi:hypoxia-inducible factor 1-alpha-like isoform X2 [Macrosteles quadrilineatus]|uniref:hypoxia-inducible factor 1-alpha-like isoform X2 n=1 Tax=Macrosteles quadrilineatus TaxID=74068 RepID=UPI0023E1ACF9|nr:hypoxia-inducible factor 1-alpha-like isoform X2 [Macrosteles quadrilineatus]